jgi:hypothetical protein
MMEFLIIHEYFTFFNFIYGIFILLVFCDSVLDCRMP